MSRSKALKKSNNVVEISSHSALQADTERQAVAKTYKLYINGAFPRSESGRYFPIKDSRGEFLANMSLASRKDLRDAVVAARNAFPAWSKKTAYNRGQILYRIAEILEDRRLQFEAELKQLGLNEKLARAEVSQSIDRLVCFAGWADKFQSFASTVNPVSSPHFVFSVPEPMGVVALICPDRPALLGLVSLLAPVIVGGNSVVLVSSETNPLSAVTFSEVLNASDVPAGVCNILTGKRAELVSHVAKHMDINAIVYSEIDRELDSALNQDAVNNLKRVIKRNDSFFNDRAPVAPNLLPAAESPYTILDTQEVKTTWHPVGR